MCVNRVKRFPPCACVPARAVCDRSNRAACTWSTWSAVGNRTPRTGELRSAPERGDDTARSTLWGPSAACTSILYRVCYDPPPMSTPAREGETIEGSRTMRNRPYPVLKCSSNSYMCTGRRVKVRAGGDNAPAAATRNTPGAVSLELPRTRAAAKICLSRSPISSFFWRGRRSLHRACERHRKSPSVGFLLTSFRRGRPGRRAGLFSFWRTRPNS